MKNIQANKGGTIRKPKIIIIARLIKKYFQSHLNKGTRNQKKKKVNEIQVGTSLINQLFVISFIIETEFTR